MANQRELSLDEVLHALAEPTRRAVVERLRGGSARVTDLAAAFDLALSSFSRHLKVLEAAGVVHRLRVGREHHMALAPEALDLLAGWVGRPMEPVPTADAAPDERVRAKARELEARLARRMEAVALALGRPPEVSPIFTPASFLARRLAARAAQDAGFARQLAEGLARFRHLGEQLARGGEPELDTVMALGVLDYAWAAEPLFREVFVFEGGAPA